MLKLGRRVGEKIMIGDDIVIEVSSVKGNSVRLGITAPEGVTIDREEIYLRKLQERLRGIDSDRS